MATEEESERSLSGDISGGSDAALSTSKHAPLRDFISDLMIANLPKAFETVEDERKYQRFIQELESEIDEVEARRNAKLTALVEDQLQFGECVADLAEAGMLDPSVVRTFAEDLLDPKLVGLEANHAAMTKDLQELDDLVADLLMKSEEHVARLTKLSLAYKNQKAVFNGLVSTTLIQEQAYREDISGSVKEIDILRKKIADMKLKQKAVTEIPSAGLLVEGLRHFDEEERQLLKCD